MGKGRIIFHVDMNSFYASVETAYRPELKGKPVAIAGDPEKRKGIIVTCNYEARAKGVKTTMPLWQAYELCPNLIALKPNFNRYREASQHMFAILSEVTPFVQPISIDEGYMDITDYSGENTPLQLAEWIQQRLVDELDLPSSIGIAPNKFLAKMASDMKKPLGITVLRKREIQDKLWPLPIGEMYGVGKKTEEKLTQIDIETIGDLAKRNVLTLKNLLGVNGERLHLRANGIDNSEVDPEAINEFKSIGNSQTFPFDTTDSNEIQQMLSQLCQSVADRMKAKQVVSENVQIMIRYHDRKTITRSRQLRDFVEHKDQINQIVLDLFYSHWNEEPIRLLGVTAQHLSHKEDVSKQLDLFNYEQEAEKEPLYNAIEQIEDKFGKEVFVNLSGYEQPKIKTSFQKDFLSQNKRKK
ncbi:DNA polymerase-4 [Alkalibacillus filiformis]|uniref:DNA polymerase IV n=1 Tax=Alkalibacillus filiformis TaxID=200990 RepID=A0ABU0DR55_9BACI|nr:DNA polymerase IV [Alkalibacillus filiformis]MDQ0350928.1 DNA polymerase-4 [Alkalibacillus filiformis]